MIKSRINILPRNSIHRDDSNITSESEKNHSSHEHQSPGGTSIEAEDSRITNSTACEESDDTEVPIKTSVSRKSINTRNESYKRTASPVRLKPSFCNESRNVSAKTLPNKKNLSQFIKMGAFLIVLSISILMWSMAEENTVKKCSYVNLQDKYPSESKYLWKSLRSAIEDIINKKTDKPAVFLFVNNGGQAAKDLIEDIAKTSSRCFDSNRRVQVENIEFTSEDAKADYGNIIAKYKNMVKEEDVVLIANLNEIPAKAARALHAICDTVTPLVRKVVIFLSLVAEHKGGKAIDTAVDTLQEMWESELMSNELGPLITRVTDEVVLLQTN